MLGRYGALACLGDGAEDFFEGVDAIEAAGDGGGQGREGVDVAAEGVLEDDEALTLGIRCDVEVIAQDGFVAEFERGQGFSRASFG